jgi:hypothetical protein
MRHDESERHRHRLEQVTLITFPTKSLTAANRRQPDCATASSHGRTALDSQTTASMAPVWIRCRDIAGRVIEIEQIAREYQVSGARDRQKFGEALDDAE